MAAFIDLLLKASERDSIRSVDPFLFLLMGG
jgi:hypothetical protein